jgi:hypothetical protein
MKYSSEESQLSELLKPLIMHFEYGKSIYDQYVKEDKIFKYALIIKKNNLIVRELLLNKGYLLPEYFQEDLVNIVKHIDDWLVSWEEAKIIAKPNENDQFVFSSSVRFPKESELRLFEYYKELSSQQKEGGCYGQ